MSPRPLTPLLLLLALTGALVLLLALARPAVGAGERWHWPLRGAVTRRFLVTPDRFAAGQHRGVSIAAQPGARVRAVCGGPVTFAGRVGSAGLVAAVACGRLSATYTHLGAVAVRRGEWVDRDAPLGSVGPGGRMQLGARVRSRRDGYLDPLTLLGAGGDRLPPAVPVGPGDEDAPPMIGPPAVAVRTVGERGDDRPASANGRGLPVGEWWLPVGAALLATVMGFEAARRLRRSHRGRAMSALAVRRFVDTGESDVRASSAR